MIHKDEEKKIQRKKPKQIVKVKISLLLPILWNINYTNEFIMNAIQLFIMMHVIVF